MGTLIKYNRPSYHERVLDANDLKKAGVEGFTKTTFPGGIFVEVPDAVAAALTDPESLLFDKDEFILGGAAATATASTATSVPGDDDDLEDDPSGTDSTSSIKKK